MIYKISDNIISVLGFSSDENYRNMKEGKFGGSLHNPAEKNMPEPYFASILNSELIHDSFASISNSKTKYTRFEELAILSAAKALEEANIDAKSPEVIFVLSTTKGNVELLQDGQGFEKERVYLSRSAQLIGNYFQNPNEVLVASNACISGVSAQLLAFDLMQSKGYKYAVVIGAEVLSKFVISGFQSFKALSQNMCKPFDANRVGLNLGEAAATLIYKQENDNISVPKNTIVFKGGAIRNDANHISGPSRTGEGLYNAISKALQIKDHDKIGFINAHGTATPYNDDMESWAIDRSGLNNVPVNSLKGYLGHTLGAAGILETIISSHALVDNNILKTMGHETFGVVKPITINTENKYCDKTGFIKLISGFGGSNAAIWFEKI